MLAGQPTSSGGGLTISSLCREAGVGRDSYYRSPPQFKDTVVAAFARRGAPQPELVTLREENAALKREKKQIVQENARALRELENTIRIYANQIQVLTLRNAELDDQFRRHAGHDARVIPVGPRRTVTRQ
jgi:transposase-like protein